MNWTSGTWAAVAIGDTVLGGDGYPWRVTAGLINHFGIDGDGANLRITMEREQVGARTGDLPAGKPVKYMPGEPRGVVISCHACQCAETPCEKHTEGKAPDAGERLPERTTSDTPKVTERSDQSPVRDPSPVLNDVSTCEEVNRKATVGRSTFPSGTAAGTGTAPYCLGCDLDAHRCPGCAAPVRHSEVACQACNAENAPSSTSTDDAPPAEIPPASVRPATSILEVPRETEIIEPAAEPMCYGDGSEPHPIGTPGCVLADVEPAPAAPYVEWTPGERAAAGVLKAAGITAVVIERQMTLAELTSHLGDTHGVPLPERDTPNGRLIGVEYRAKLADLHFVEHERGQATGEKWQARGRTPHTHPVMDRPTEGAKPKRGRMRA